MHKLQYFLIFFLLSLFFISCQKTSKKFSLKKACYIEKESFENYPIKNHLSEKSEFNQLEYEVERMMSQLEIKGVSVAIAKDGRLVYAKGFGYADAEKKEKVQPYHMFRIASVSKLVTAVAIMKLNEEKKIKLQDKVFGEEGILNDKKFQDIQDERAKNIEILHLLHHTGGWRNRFRSDPMFRPLEIAEFMKVKSPPSIETLIQFMLGENMVAEPGDFYDYSNFGYCLLGYIIEKVTGKTYENYLLENILKPLRVERMRIGKNQFLRRFAGEVKYYDHKPEKKRLSIYNTGDSVSRVYEGTNIEGLNAAGGWIASPIELIRLVNVIDGWDNPKDILNKKSIERMITPEDSLENMVIGWKEVNEERWLRTGSLIGTGIVVMRQSNGITWVLVTNTSSWRGPRFSYDIMAAMQRGIQSVEKFPDYDLFDRFSPPS